MKKYIYPLAITAAIIAATSCSDNEVTTAIDQPIPDSQKEMISFSMSDAAASTRAGFPVSTNIAMRIQSNEKDGDGIRYTRTLATAAVDNNLNDNSFSTVSFAGEAYTRYWDDAFGRKALLSVYAVAVPNGSQDITNPISGEGAKKLESLLSEGDASKTWGSNANNTITWQVTTSNQTKDGGSTVAAPGSTIDKEDLAYSNNIKENGENGVYWYDFVNSGWVPSEDGTGASTHGNGQMVFRQPTDADPSAPGKFDKGHLVFKHALSRLTVILKKDATSFGSGEFKFKENSQITLYSMPVSGTLDIALGTWSTPTTGTISGMANTISTSTAEGTYMAQMLPGYIFTKEDNANVLDFTIDDNTYYVTKDMIFNALKANAGTGSGKNGLPTDVTSYTMEQGKNYSIGITVKKAAITNITATLVDWNEVKGSMDIDNSHIEITTQMFQDSEGSDKYEENHPLENHWLLRHTETATLTTSEPAADTYKDYSGSYGDATTALPGSSNKWTAKDWYFKDNLTAYHIRSINKLAYGENGVNVKTPDVTESEKDPVSYFEMVNGPQTGTDGKDYHWGAPMKSSANLKYDKDKGFETSLYQGILSTHSDINITEFHMMSNIDVILTTPAAPANNNNSVVLYDDSKETKGCTVEFIDVLTKATVDMGTGKVSATTPTTTPVKIDSPSTTYAASYYTTTSTKTKAFTYAFVPQSLSNGTAPDVKHVNVKITTPDGNTYFVKALDEVKVNGSENKITEWLPNHRYVYTFNLTKTGIANITATLVNWDEVIGGTVDIDLEK